MGANPGVQVTLFRRAGMDVLYVVSMTRVRVPKIAGVVPGGAADHPVSAVEPRPR